ncbi:MAG: acetate/propionate family kinase [Candidatus Omnitrophota bacterium]
MKSKAGRNILVFNCGSSSLKYRLIRMPQEDELVCGEAQRVGIKTQGKSSICHSVRGVERTIQVDLPDHAVALRRIMELLKEDCRKDKRLSIDVFAHRYVHGGNVFSRTVQVTPKVREQLSCTLDLAPLHNPVIYGLIELCAAEFPRIKQYAVFDTSFHSTIPKEFSSYAIPAKLAARYDLHKVGFHGISHNYVMQEAARFLKRDCRDLKMISCHLGTGGSSVCAIDGGKSVNNSMGFTPLEGLMMNTRSGDLDLGVIFYIMALENFSGQQAEEMLIKRSGILGVYDSSSDLRDVVKSIGVQPRAKIVFDMYVRGIRKYVGYYSLILQKADVLIFTDSMGAGMPLVRSKVCESMDIFGIKLDTAKNSSYKEGIMEISAAGSQAHVLVVPTNEEIMIARQAHKESERDHCR